MSKKRVKAAMDAAWSQEHDRESPERKRGEAVLSAVLRNASEADRDAAYAEWATARGIRREGWLYGKKKSS